MELQSGGDPDEDEHADELPWDNFSQFTQKWFGYTNQLLQAAGLRWQAAVDAGSGGAGLVRCMRSTVVRPDECTAKFSELPFWW